MREIERLRKRLDILIYCKPRHGRVCGRPGLSLTSGGSIRAARKKMTPQLLFKILASPLQGLFFSLECECGLGAKARSMVKNLSKSHLISGCLRKKFPNSNPDAKSAPKPLNSRNFPLFPGICRFLFHRSNIGDSPNIFSKINTDKCGEYKAETAADFPHSRSRFSPFYPAHSRLNSIRQDGCACGFAGFARPQNRKACAALEIAARGVCENWLRTEGSDVFARCVRQRVMKSPPACEGAQYLNSALFVLSLAQTRERKSVFGR